MEKFDFQEALSFMKCGLAVKGPGNRVYRIIDGKLICYPKPVERPKQWRVEIKLNVDVVLSKEWSLYETASE